MRRTALCLLTLGVVLGNEPYLKEDDNPTNLGLGGALDPSKEKTCGKASCLAGLQLNGQNHHDVRKLRGNDDADTLGDRRTLLRDLQLALIQPQDQEPNESYDRSPRSGTPAVLSKRTEKTEYSHAYEPWRTALQRTRIVNPEATHLNPRHKISPHKVVRRHLPLSPALLNKLNNNGNGNANSNGGDDNDSLRSVASFKEWYKDSPQPQPPIKPPSKPSSSDSFRSASSTNSDDFHSIHSDDSHHSSSPKSPAKQSSPLQPLHHSRSSAIDPAGRDGRSRKFGFGDRSKDERLRSARSSHSPGSLPEGWRERYRHRKHREEPKPFLNAKSSPEARFRPGKLQGKRQRRITLGDEPEIIGRRKDDRNNGHKAELNPVDGMVRINPSPQKIWHEHHNNIPNEDSKRKLHGHDKAGPPMKGAVKHDHHEQNRHHEHHELTAKERNVLRAVSIGGAGALAAGGAGSVTWAATHPKPPGESQSLSRYGSILHEKDDKSDGQQETPQVNSQKGPGKKQDDPSMDGNKGKGQQ